MAAVDFQPQHHPDLLATYPEHERHCCYPPLSMNGDSRAHLGNTYNIQNNHNMYNSPQSMNTLHAITLHTFATHPHPCITRLCSPFSFKATHGWASHKFSRKKTDSTSTDSTKLLIESTTCST